MVGEDGERTRLALSLHFPGGHAVKFILPKPRSVAVLRRSIARAAHWAAGRSRRSSSPDASRLDEQIRHRLAVGQAGRGDVSGTSSAALPQQRSQGDGLLLWVGISSTVAEPPVPRALLRG